MTPIKDCKTETEWIETMRSAIGNMNYISNSYKCFLETALAKLEEMIKPSETVVEPTETKKIENIEPVNEGAFLHPSHYNKEGRKECWEEMEILFGKEAVCIFDCLNQYKYWYRMGTKDGNTLEQDFEKLKAYEKHSRRMNRSPGAAKIKYKADTVMFGTVDNIWKKCDKDVRKYFNRIRQEVDADDRRSSLIYGYWQTFVTAVLRRPPRNRANGRNENAPEKKET